jgi:hypothetical protein
MEQIFVAFPTFQVEMLPSKTNALENMNPKSVTSAKFQPDMSALNFEAAKEL